MLYDRYRCVAADVGCSANRGRRSYDRVSIFFHYVCQSDTCHHAGSPTCHSQKILRLSCRTPSGQQIARVERELAALQIQVKTVEETYGIDNLHLTVARGYVTKLRANGRISRWLENHQQEYLGEFQKIAEIDSIAPFKDAPGG